MSTKQCAGHTPRNDDEGPFSQNSSDTAASTDQPGPIGADGASQCDNCGFSTLNGWELRLVAAEELDLDVRGHNALLCRDCREEHRVNGGGHE